VSLTRADTKAIGQMGKGVTVVDLLN